jgi:hypothetical protein
LLRLDADRQILDQIEPALREAGDAEACAMLALVARESVSVPDEELQSALRRTLLVLAAGGDPHRELEIDGRAVSSLADDLDSRSRRAELEGALRALKDRAEGLPRATYLLEALLDEPDLAWRSLAIALLAEELAEEDD